MSAVARAFLAALSAAMRGRRCPDPLELSAPEWEAFFRLADEQQVLPMIFEAVYRCPSFESLDADRQEHYQAKALRVATRQIVQTNEFLDLMLAAQAQGLDPVVLKGITVRSLYPLPMLRPSVDEDLLIPPEEGEAWHAFLLGQGLRDDQTGVDRSRLSELSYHKDASPTYLELHMNLFPPESDAYGDCNRLFTDVLARTERFQVEDVSLRVLSPTDHLLYLICHAYKHFLHSGFGIRQVCDICLFAERMGEQIDWKTVLENCRSIRIERFTAAIFHLGGRYLGFSEPAAFAKLGADPDPLLEDILAGGLYGVNDVNRAHSSTLTLDAVAAQKEGRRRAGRLHALFPPLHSLRGRYPYLYRCPWLLPVAWIQRIWQYLTKRKKEPQVAASESLRIGENRIRMLRDYHIID